MMPLQFLLPLILAWTSDARKISFPPISGYHAQQPVFGQEGIDISTGSVFVGLTTYANLPYVHCLAGKDVEVEKYDIAILGAPFDTVSQHPLICMEILVCENAISEPLEFEQDWAHKMRWTTCGAPGARKLQR